MNTSVELMLWGRDREYLFTLKKLLQGERLLEEVLFRIPEKWSEVEHRGQTPGPFILVIDTEDSRELKELLPQVLGIKEPNPGASVILLSRFIEISHFRETLEHKAQDLIERKTEKTVKQLCFAINMGITSILERRTRSLTPAISPEPLKLFLSGGGEEDRGPVSPRGEFESLPWLFQTGIVKNVNILYAQGDRDGAEKVRSILQSAGYLPNLEAFDRLRGESGGIFLNTIFKNKSALGFLISSCSFPGDEPVEELKEAIKRYATREETLRILIPIWISPEAVTEKRLEALEGLIGEVIRHDREEILELPGYLRFHRGPEEAGEQSLSGF